MEEQVLSISQMMELIELGIDTSKASMCWYRKIDKYILCNDGSLLSGYFAKIPTFTLQDTLEILPKTIEAYKDGSKLPLMITITGSGKYAIVYDNPFYKNGKVGLTRSESLLEAAFSMLKFVKQNNYI